MQNYIKSNVEGTSINTNQTNTNNTNTNNTNSVNMSGLQTEVMDFNSNGTINTTPKKITSINLNASKPGSTYKTFEELCILYGNGKTSFTNEDVSDMFTNGYASKGMISNFIKSGYVDGSAIGYLLENGQITVDEARDLAVKTYNDSKAPFGAGHAAEVYLVKGVDEEAHTITRGYTTYEYARVEEKDGVTTYYDANGDAVVIDYPDKSVYPKNNEVFYYEYEGLGEDEYMLERNSVELKNGFSLNPSIGEIKEQVIFSNDGKVTSRYIDADNNGYTTTVTRSHFDNYNGYPFYTVEKDGEVIAARYGNYDKKYDVVLDGDKLKDYNPSNNYDRMGFKYLNVSEAEVSNNYNTIKDMAGHSSSIDKTTVWTDGQEHHYVSKQMLEGGGVEYVLENNMGTKKVLPNGDVVTTITATDSNGKTYSYDSVYRTYDDGSYSVQHRDFMVKYNNNGYDLYAAYEDGSRIFNNHYDYYRG